MALLEFGDELSRHAAAATPIGMGCKVCERLDCPQRAVPPLGRRLAVDENRTTFVPYPVEPAGP
nr:MULTISPECIES: short-chain fatty acyl-CoA regulator family protein [Streptomyces]